MRPRGLPVALLLLGALASCSQTTRPSAVPTTQGSPAGPAIVTGGIDPCEGIPIPGGPAHVAGTVTVLTGQVTWRNTSPGSYEAIFPTEVAGRATVGVNGTYRFVLAPGNYVISATLPPPANVHPYTQFAVHNGSAIRADVPNMCK